ncbi:MAG: hypothetical protein O2960_06725 [Verrucomicrobia bacterium]|nr:hypothetical protein [Verrucomicrobiota bacterium]
MSAEPHNESKKRLRSYARHRRRDAASLGEMPPAVRRTLQSEVSKTFRKGSASPAWPDRIQSLWPRFAIAFGVLACALFGAVFWQIYELNSSGRRDLARANTAGREFPAGGKTAIAANRETDTAASPTEGSAIEQSLAKRHPVDRSRSSRGLPERIELADGFAPSDTTGQPMALAASAPVPAHSDPADREPTPLQTDSKTLAEIARMPVPLGKAQMRQDQATANPEPVSSNVRGLESDSVGLASTADSAVLAEAQAEVPRSFKSIGIGEEKRSTDSGVVSLQFTQLDPASRYRKNFNSPPYPEILRSFEARIQGTEVRIVDRDASVYEGSILLAENEVSPDADRSPETTSNAAVSTTGVSGVNYMRTDLSLPSPEIGSVNRVRFQAAGQNQSLNQRIVFTGSFFNLMTPSNNQRVEGTVLIGGSNAFNIEATRNKP